MESKTRKPLPRQSKKRKILRGMSRRKFGGHLPETISELNERDGLRLSSILRINHACSFLFFFGGALLWLLCVSNLAQRPSMEHEFYMYTNTSVLENFTGLPAQTQFEEWFSCPTQDLVSFAVVQRGTPGVCATRFALPGTNDVVVSPMAGCDADVMVLSALADCDPEEVCEQMCRCAAPQACTGFSLQINDTHKICRLHIPGSDCQQPIPNDYLNASAEVLLSFQPNEAALSNTWNLTSIGYSAVDGTDKGLCFAKQNTCPNTCLGFSCDELSSHMGVTCE